MILFFLYLIEWIVRFKDEDDVSEFQNILLKTRIIMFQAENKSHENTQFERNTKHLHNRSDSCENKLMLNYYRNLSEFFDWKNWRWNVKKKHSIQYHWERKWDRNHRFTTASMSWSILIGYPPNTNRWSNEIHLKKMFQVTFWFISISFCFYWKIPISEWLKCISRRRLPIYRLSIEYGQFISI